MSMPSTTISDFGQQPSAHIAISAMRPFYWCIRRELWEHRSIYLAPLTVAAFNLVGFLIGAPNVIHKMRMAGQLGAEEMHAVIEQPYDFAALFLMGIVFLVSIFYSLEALHSERRDRSILFWKSLPASDLTVVLSKISIPVVVLPLIAVALTVITHLVMLLLNMAILEVNGFSAALLWRHLSLTQMWMMMLYHLLALHGLWFAPAYAWMLLISAWARRAVILWAVLPLAAVGVIEKIAFNTTHFVHWLQYRFGGAPGADAYPGGHLAVQVWSQVNLGSLLINAHMWSGLIIAALLLVAAARVRRSCGPI